MTIKEFLGRCTACGGNWVAMLESGCRNLWPEDLEKLQVAPKYANDGGGFVQYELLCKFVKAHCIIFEEVIQ